MRVARFVSEDDPRFGVVGVDGETEIIAPLKGDPMYAGYELTGEKIPLEQVRLLAPVLPRSKVVAIGKNYRAHADEMGGEVPKEPLVFLKPNTSVIGPGEPIFHPKQSTNVHFEGELAVVIGRICRNLRPEDASQVIHGWTVANDVTARDLQAKDGQWARAKGFDTFCPLGPWIETDLDATNLRLRTTLNGEVKQDASTSDMVFGVPELLAHITSFMTLLPGDVVLTGTPEGVGQMRVGDHVAVTIEGIGTLANPVVSEEE